MKKVLFVVIATCTLILTSCNKDQKAIKQIEGKWKSVSQDGQTLDPDDQTIYNFSSCKLKDSEYCDVTAEYSDDTYENFEYNVTSDGTIMTWKTEDGFILTGTIDELTDTKLTWTFSFFDTSTIIFEKQ
ncbi:MAG: hypothetical protein ABJG68_13675 [Crocinitomicaceae bacterium]